MSTRRSVCHHAAGLLVLLVWSVQLGACAEEPVAKASDFTKAECALSGQPLPFASELVSFERGLGGGFGSHALPGVVLGPPVSTSLTAGSVDVVSLGVGGEIVVSFGDRAIVDGPGHDLVVFENAFAIAGGGVFSEPGEVSVSQDGVEWFSFGCDPVSLEGCAGATPTGPWSGCELSAEQHPQAGDRFDLAEVGLRTARFVRIVDAGGAASGATSGFDLDAVGALHLE